MKECVVDTAKQLASIRKKLNRHFAEWVVGSMQRKLFWDGPQKSYHACLDADEDEIANVGTETNCLHTWHLYRYINAVLNEGHFPRDELALAARYAQATLFFEKAFADAEKGGSVLMRDSTLYFSLNVLAGWKSEAGAVGKALYKGLDTSLLDLRHTDAHQKGMLFRHFWFLMHLYCQADGVTLDISKYSYPADMSPYAEVLADWRTTDLNRVQAFVSAMSDFHLSEARVTAHDEIAEFDTEDRMLFPHEILTFLRLREWAGLPNPSSFEHPLMNQPLAKLPEPVPLPQPETPLLEDVITKFKLEYPGSFAA